MQKTTIFPAGLRMRHIKSKTLAFLIEHAPCCLLSFVAGFAGLPMLNHNPGVEFVFAIAGAFIGEYLGHKFFHKHEHCSKDSCARATIRRYGLSLLIGLSTWGLHQQLFHQPHDQIDVQATQNSAQVH